MSKFLDSDRVSELWSKTKEYINSQIAQNSAGGGALPSGVITIWSGTANNIPTGWALCDGTNGTPDLRDKFVLGAGTTHVVGTTGGAETVTLTVEQMPSHNHTFNTMKKATEFGSIGWIAYGAKGTTANDSTTNNTGGSQPHENMPPYYTLCYIMKL